MSLITVGLLLKNIKCNEWQLFRTVRFFLFGFYATYIAAKFFHSDNEYVSLMMTFTVFAAGFLMRPLGAIFLVPMSTKSVVVKV